MKHTQTHPECTTGRLIRLLKLVKVKVLQFSTQLDKCLRQYGNLVSLLKLFSNLNEFLLPNLSIYLKKFMEVYFLLNYEMQRATIKNVLTDNDNKNRPCGGLQGVCQGCHSV